MIQLYAQIIAVDEPETNYYRAEMSIAPGVVVQGLSLKGTPLSLGQRVRVFQVGSWSGHAEHGFAEESVQNTSLAEFPTMMADQARKQAPYTAAAQYIASRVQKFRPYYRTGMVCEILGSQLMIIDDTDFSLQLLPVASDLSASDFQVGERVLIDIFPGAPVRVLGWWTKAEEIIEIQIYPIGEVFGDDFGIFMSRILSPTSSESISNMMRYSQFYPPSLDNIFCDFDADIFSDISPDFASVGMRMDPSGLVRLISRRYAPAYKYAQMAQMELVESGPQISLRMFPGAGAVLWVPASLLGDYIPFDVFPGLGFRAVGNRLYMGSIPRGSYWFMEPQPFGPNPAPFNYGDYIVEFGLPVAFNKPFTNGYGSYLPFTFHPIDIATWTHLPLGTPSKYHGELNHKFGFAGGTPLGSSVEIGIPKPIGDWNDNQWPIRINGYILGSHGTVKYFPGTDLFGKSLGEFRDL